MSNENYKFLETRTSKIFLLDNNIVLSEEKPGTFSDIEDAIHTTEQVNKIHAEGEWGVIVDLRKNKGISKEARDYYARKNAFPGRVAIALLIDSYFSKVLANFFVGFSKPETPTKLFYIKRRSNFMVEGTHQLKKTRL